MTLELEEYFELKKMEEVICKKAGPDKLRDLQHSSFDAAVYAAKKVFDFSLKEEGTLELISLWRIGIIKGFYDNIDYYARSNIPLSEIPTPSFNKAEIRDLIIRA
tara:strand:+ start:3262 stop:3576 length:315 start_codon:yes stop_codon:yes gene_type:complete